MKEKDKRIVASVILGVALVSLITALVVAFANSLMMFIDVNHVQASNAHYDYNFIVGGVTLGTFAIGVVLVAVFFASKKKRFAVNLALLIVFVADCIVSIIMLRIHVPFYSKKANIVLSSDYSLFSTYLTVALTLIVSAVLTFLSWLYLTNAKKREAQAAESAEEAPAEERSDDEKA